MERVRLKKNDKVAKPPKAKPDLAVVADDSEADGITIMVNSKWRMVYDGLQFQVQMGRVNQTGKHAGELYWTTKAYIRHLDDACEFLAVRQIYAVPGVYGMEAIEALGKALDEIKADIRSMITMSMQAHAQHGLPLTRHPPKE